MTANQHSRQSAMIVHFGHDYPNGGLRLLHREGPSYAGQDGTYTIFVLAAFDDFFLVD